MSDDNLHLWDEDLKRESKKRNIGFLAVLLILIIAATGIVMYAKQTSRQHLAIQVKQINIQTAAELDKSLEPYAAMLTALSDDPLIQGLPATPKGHEEALKKMGDPLNSHHNILAIYLGDENSQMYIQPEQELPEEYDPTSRPWYKSARDAGELVWTDPYSDGFSETMTASLAVPVKAEGAFVGVLGMDFNLNEPSAVITGPIQENSFSFLVDSANTITAFPADENGLNLRMVGKRVQSPALLEQISSPQDSAVQLDLDFNTLAAFPEEVSPDVIEMDKLINIPNLKNCYVYSSSLNETGWQLISVVW